MKNKGFGLVELLVVIAIVGILAAVMLAVIRGDRADACGFFTDCDAPKNEINEAAKVQNTLRKSTPVPKLTNSLERENVAKRAQLFDSPDKISYIYLTSFGKVMAFYTVKGKVSSLRSYMTPTEKLVYGNGNTCNQDGYVDSPDCYVVASPDLDGTYGENVAGIFFFTTDGTYVEWNGEYMMADQPLKLTTQPELIREIK